MKNLIFLALFITVSPDVEVDHLGPTVVWTAHTKRGEEFLRGVPAEFASPYVEVKDGVEKIVGRAKFNPEYKSLAVCPSCMRGVEKLAEKAGLKVKRDD